MLVKTTTAINEILSTYFSPLVVQFLKQSGTKSKVIGKGGYTAASPQLRRLGIDVDGWPVPPAGLFVVDERTVYLREIDVMTVVHEHGHAIDCALGGGAYRSGYDPRIRSAFAGARTFVTPYAACGLDEYFAECIRAIVGANTPRSPWPTVSAERFRSIDPHGFEVISAMLAEAEDAATFEAGEQIALRLVD